MKKFLKFLFYTCSVLAASFGIYYVIKNVINKDDSDDDFDELDDDFDDFETDDETTTKESREYVPINLNSSSEEETTETPASEDVEDAEQTEEVSNDSETDAE